jgi:inner membrane protein
VDFYQKSERSVKYGILFIFLTFMTFFLFEVLNPIRIHPLQYLMVGFALCLFYVLLLSISEHLGFTMAYLVASISTTILIGAYAAKVLRSGGRATVMGLILTGLYGYLYVLLHLEDYALLFGAVGLFLILAVVMFITRNIDWYVVQLQTAKPDGSSD